MDASPAPQTRRAPRRRGPTRADVLLLAALLVAIPAVRRATTAEATGGRILLVRCDREPERELDARRDMDVELQGPLGTTVLRLQSGQAWIAAAPCRNQLCRRMGRISGPGRALVCMPNRILVRFAAAPSDIDGITR
jgi:hypothetical protein